MRLAGDSTLPRRRFLGQLLGGAAATALLPSAALGVVTAPRRLSLAEELGLAVAEDELFWKMLKDKFPLRPGFTLLNAANLCPSPNSVIETVTGLTHDIDADASFQNRAKFTELREGARAAVAVYLGADPTEIAITRNTTEGNNTVVNGLALNRGDEVVIWDQNHPSNSLSWDVRAERVGFTVKRVKTPPSPRSADELLEPFRAAITANTRAIAVTHLSSTSGVALPVKQLCQLAREKGIPIAIDGAQTVGSLALNLHDLGCDFYTTSSHKWLLGPKEAGILYVRKERVASLWPNIVGLGWQNAVKDGTAKKFETLGQRDDARVAAVGKAVEFHNAIGKDKVEERVRALAAATKVALQKKIPSVKFHTPLDPGLSGGIVIFTAQGLDPRPVYDSLYKKSDIGCATSGGEFPGIRYSAHIYNTMDEVEKAVTAVSALVSV